MTFTIEWYDAAYDDLKSLDCQIAQRIVKKVRSIEHAPFHFIDKLEGHPFFKLRIGDYRVILDIKSSDETIKIILVGHRSKVY